MKKAIIIVAASLLTLAICDAQVHNHPIIDYAAKTIDGDTVSMREYFGKVCLIVNAPTSENGAKRFERLSRLREKYKDRGFEILLFPCFDFTPESERASGNFYKEKFGLEFPVFERIYVSGKKAHPIYKYLTFDGTLPVKENFEAFLINRYGVPIKKFAANSDFKLIEREIRKALRQKPMK